VLTDPARRPRFEISRRRLGGYGYRPAKGV